MKSNFYIKAAIFYSSSFKLPHLDLNCFVVSHFMLRLILMFVAFKAAFRPLSTSFSSIFSLRNESSENVFRSLLLRPALLVFVCDIFLNFFWLKSCFRRINQSENFNRLLWAIESLDKFIKARGNFPVHLMIERHNLRFKRFTCQEMKEFQTFRFERNLILICRCFLSEKLLRV